MSARVLTEELLNMQHEGLSGLDGICSAQDGITARMPAPNGVHGKEIKKNVTDAYLA